MRMAQFLCLASQPVPVTLYGGEPAMLNVAKWLVGEVRQILAQVSLALAVDVEVGDPILLWLEFLFLRHGHVLSLHFAFLPAYQRRITGLKA
jgi:hypothetical protein